jgi:hypothetical protein
MFWVSLPVLSTQNLEAAGRHQRRTWKLTAEKEFEEAIVFAIAARSAPKADRAAFCTASTVPRRAMPDTGTISQTELCNAIPIWKGEVDFSVVCIEHTVEDNSALFKVAVQSGIPVVHHETWLVIRLRAD